MAHREQQAFCRHVKMTQPKHFHGVNVLDAGSLDINGSNRYLFENSNYAGIDISEGANVDEVSLIHEYSTNVGFDTVISTEAFEHDQHWEKSLVNLISLLRCGGLFLFTCATDGRTEHGTINSGDTSSSPLTTKIDGWSNYYKNLTEPDIRSVIDIDAIFSEYKFKVNTTSCDLYFYGLKR